jgi:sulfide:quinone oxidoreductase
MPHGAARSSIVVMPRFEHSDSDPLRVLIAGGGVAALEALVALHALAPGRVIADLVSASPDFVYRPLEVGEPFGLGHPERHPLAEIAGALGAGVIVDAITHVDHEDHAVTTASGDRLRYDVLLVAVGARSVPAFEHGVTFDRETSAEDFDDVLMDLAGGIAPRVAIIVPDGVQWTLPAYELALLTAASGPADTRVTVVTHEAAPLGVFGTRVAGETLRMLDEAGVALRLGVHPDVVTSTALRVGGAWLEVDRIVSLPRITGPRLAGLPADRHGFLAVDDLSRVVGVDDVFAAGDGTGVPIKQGGLAAQQAEVAATAIAARAGADVEVRPLHPVLRGLLRTGAGPRYLRAELPDVEATSTFATEPLWWPPSKIASRWLAPHLARIDADRRAGVARG